MKLTTLLIFITVIVSSCDYDPEEYKDRSTTKRLVKSLQTNKTWVREIDTLFHVGDTIHTNDAGSTAVIIR